MELENKIKEYLVKEVGGRRYLRKYSRRLFKDWLPLLKEYIKQTGNNSVPSRTIFNGENLGRWWMNSIMMRYRKGILNKEHEQQLRGLGMDLDKAKGSSSRRKQVSNT